ncbi:SH3 domain-containing protein [Glaciecola sp. MH2013]|uniref:SH3 domain-containing protein n=1 Tax=Glaciecola sp. MH2013 TaxID=2785524 RepID=UPI00189EE443|nr:SH3 domain-containing protein [Glaciecola sp. MH2013]MBF7074554.1 SH3 domain-containing protein [Glaciecola sp. MH2013]
MKSTLNHIIIALVALAASYSPFASADDLVVTIVEPYIDFRTGPASEYPIFHVAEQGEKITVVKKKTGWYKAISIDGKEGWVSAEQLGKTLKPNGEVLYVPTGTFEDYGNRNFELSVFGGVLENVTSMTVATSWNWTGNLVAEATYTQALGDFSENKLWSVRLQHHTFPEWKLSPYLTIGAGQISTRPRSNLVQSGDEERKSDLYEVGGGLRYYIARNVTVKLEYRRIAALTDRDDQERLEEFRLGFAVFF